jgi:uncharacterized protein YgfB (UPF0149 family)
MNSLPDIAELDKALLKVDATMGAAESHGVLCGMLCAQGTADLSVWMDHALGDQEQGNVFLHETVYQMSGLHQCALEKLNDVSGGFVLLLPDDDELPVRTEALAAWCQGFVYGLAAGGITGKSDLPEDTQELLHDFIEISRAGHDGDDAGVNEEDEMAYIEVMEYVRTGVLLINEELQPLQMSPTLH